jgi:dTDP-D-glucose 4,6-dehydratase
MAERILITGGAGFVGSNLALSFKRDRLSATVIAFDNLKRRGSELALSRLRAGGVEFMHGDVRSMDDLASTGSANVLVEASAEPSVMPAMTAIPIILFTPICSVPRTALNMRGSMDQILYFCRPVVFIRSMRCAHCHSIRTTIDLSFAAESSNQA